MSHERNLKYLNDKRIVYRRDPITDKPDQENECYMFYLNGTYVEQEEEFKFRVTE